MHPYFTAGRCTEARVCPSTCDASVHHHHHHHYRRRCRRHKELIARTGSSSSL